MEIVRGNFILFFYFLRKSMRRWYCLHGNKNIWEILYGMVGVCDLKDLNCLKYEILFQNQTNVIFGLNSNITPKLCLLFQNFQMLQYYLKLHIKMFQNYHWTRNSTIPCSPTQLLSNFLSNILIYLYFKDSFEIFINKLM